MPVPVICNKALILVASKPFDVGDIAYGDGTLTGGYNWKTPAWITSGILPKVWSNGTVAGGSGIAGWNWDGNWILA